jgi:putative sterol carrier protein
LDAFFATVPQSLVLGSLPDGVSVTFDLQGEGGGVWTVIRRGEVTEVLRESATAPDCRLRCTVADFRALISGDLDPRRGFLERRLLVEGDVGLVLRLQRTVL